MLSQVFSREQEIALKKYLMRCAAMYYGLTVPSTLSLAYQFAKSVSAPMPKVWKEKERAGIKWLAGFRDRHQDLTLRRPFSTSIARATAFNPFNVGRFFENLHTVMDRHHFPMHRIYNMDESGFSTVPNKHSKVLCMKGIRQIGAIASAERGNMLTVAVTVSADGNKIPPYFVFPRAKMQSHYLKEAPIGSSASANKSGWMMAPDFFNYMKNHFQKYVQANANSPVLLLLDNHDSHMSIQTLKFCKENSIIVVSFPPHCTHRLQPLDRTVFSALKTVYNTCCEDFIRTYNKPIRMDDIPGILRSAFDTAIIPKTVQAGFQCTGIFPVNSNIFTEVDFLPSQVTDRDSFGYVPETEEQPAAVPNPENTTGIIAPNENLEDVSISSDDIPVAANVDVDFEQTLQQIPPYPKAPPRVQSSKGRKKRRTAILTDDNVMEVLEKEQSAVAEKKAAIAQRKIKTAERKVMKIAEKLSKTLATKKA